MKHKVMIDVHIPEPPNFLYYGNIPLKVDVADMAIEALREVGRLWTEELVGKALRRRHAEQPRGLDTSPKGQGDA